MRNTYTNFPIRTRGFTLVEMLVIAPFIILLLGAMIAYITTLTADGLNLSQKSAMAYDIQNALDIIETDSTKATQFLDTSGTLTSPQGKNNGITAFTSADSLVMGTIATDKDPINPDRTPIYYANQPNPCNGDPTKNPLLITKAIYFLQNGSLWKRTVVPTNNTNSPADDFTVCTSPWQRNSCAIGQNASLCRSEDVELVKNVSAFSVRYFATSTSTTALAASDAKKAQSIEITIAANKKAAGETVTQSGTIRVTRLNDIDTTLVAPTDTPVITTTTTNTNAITFDWNAIPYATSYSVSYSINGAAFTSTTVTGTSFTVNVARKDAVSFRVAARNTYGTSAVAQTSASSPSTVPCNLSSGWSTNSTTFNNAVFTKTSSGVVMLGGVIKKSSAATANEVICTLPDGYRPAKKLIFGPVTSGTTQGRIDVLPNGDVTYVSGNVALISLEGIHFLARSTATTYNLVGANGWTAFGGAHENPQAMLDSSGRAHIHGVAKGGTTTANTLAFTIPSSIDTTTDGFDIYPARAGAVGSMQLNNDNTIFYRGSGGNTYWSLQAMFYPASTGGWTTPTLSAGWVRFSTTFANAGYRKAADDIVSLHGLIKSGTVTSGTVLFTLPVGSRPLKTVPCSQITSPDAFGRIDIAPNGQVILREGVNTNWLSLAGCDFLAEQ